MEIKSCTSVYIYTSTHVHTHTHQYTHTPAYTHTHQYTCPYVFRDRMCCSSYPLCITPHMHTPHAPPTGMYSGYSPPPPLPASTSSHPPQCLCTVVSWSPTSAPSSIECHATRLCRASGVMWCYVVLCGLMWMCIMPQV